MMTGRVTFSPAQDTNHLSLLVYFVSKGVTILVDPTAGKYVVTGLPHRDE